MCNEILLSIDSIELLTKLQSFKLKKDRRKSNYMSHIIIMSGVQLTT